MTELSVALCLALTFVAGFLVGHAIGSGEGRTAPAENGVDEEEEPRVP